MPETDDAANRKVVAAWLPRYSLRHLLVGVTAICIFLGIGIAVYRQYTFERRVMRALSKRGGFFPYQPGEERALVWGLLSTTPDENFDGIWHLDDSDIDNINRLRVLTELSFIYTDADDNDVSRLRAFKGLKQLRLFGSNVTWEGIQRLPSFPDLEILDVSRRQIPVEMEATALAKFPGVSIRFLEQNANGDFIVKGTIPTDKPNQ